jgi:hypothetical protein
MLSWTLLSHVLHQVQNGKNDVRSLPISIMVPEKPRYLRPMKEHIYINTDFAFSGPMSFRQIAVLDLVRECLCRLRVSMIRHACTSTLEA